MESIFLNVDMKVWLLLSWLTWGRCPWLQQSLLFILCLETLVPLSFMLFE